MSHSERSETSGWTTGTIAKQLSNIYYAAGDPGSLGGVDRLYRRAKDLGIPVSRASVANYLAKQLPYSIHKPARHTFTRNRTYVGHIDQQWQADLAGMQTLVNENDGYRYILTCIDILSRYAWAIPVRSKGSKDMVIAFKKLFRAAHPRLPQRLQTDKGKEFFNREVSALLQKHGIHHFASNSDQKAAVVERFNRTLKNRIWVHFTANRTERYLEILPDTVYAYNHTFHRSIRMRPVDVDGEPAAGNAWMNLFYKDTCKRGAHPKSLEEGQRVRIARWKGDFEKGYVPNWSREHFFVRKDLNHPQTVYKLEDASGEPIEGYFYNKEVQAIPRVTLQVDRIVRRRKRSGRNEVLVKWLGWPEKFSKWIPSADLKRYQQTPANRALANG